MHHEDISNKIRYLAADTLLSYAKSRYDELVAGNGDFVHYSSDQTVYKILEKEKIWLRNISFMNDYAEIETGRSILLRTSKQLKKGEQDVQLSPREFQIFDLLVQNIGIVVPRDIILDRIWGLETEVSSNNIDSYVKLIRKKLEQADGGVQGYNRHRQPEERTATEEMAGRKGEP